MQIILALGNRPKAEKFTYTLSIAVYASLSTYLIFNTVILTVKAFCVRLLCLVEEYTPILTSSFHSLSAQP